MTSTRKQPLLVIDGNSFAHRAYHAVPKTIRRAGNKGAGAIVGFANFLLRLFEGEQPRAVLVGWDTLNAPTYRHKALESYQAGRHFDQELLDQLDILPEFVTACGFASAKAAGYEADDFLAAAVAVSGGEKVGQWSGGACAAAWRSNNRPLVKLPLSGRERGDRGCTPWTAMPRSDVSFLSRVRAVVRPPVFSA